MPDYEPSPESYIDWGYRSANGRWRIVQRPGAGWIALRYDVHGRFMYYCDITVDDYGDFR